MGKKTKLVSGSPAFLGRMSSDEPRPLPYSAYPKAGDVAWHGVRPLPESLPLVDFARAAPHRSSQYSTVVVADLTRAQMLQMAWVIAASFARREPQARHLRPPKHPPAGLMEARHTAPFGTDSFGPWDTETHLYWLIRLTALTDPTSPKDAIEVNEEILVQSLAILDGEGRVIGGTFNETMPPFDVEPPFRGTIRSSTPSWRSGSRFTPRWVPRTRRHCRLSPYGTRRSGRRMARVGSVTIFWSPAPTISRKRMPSSSWRRARSATGCSAIHTWSPRPQTSGRGRPSRLWAG